MALRGSEMLPKGQRHRSGLSLPVAELEGPAGREATNGPLTWDPSVPPGGFAGGLPVRGSRAAGRKSSRSCLTVEAENPQHRARGRSPGVCQATPADTAPYLEKVLGRETSPRPTGRGGPEVCCAGQ